MSFTNVIHLNHVKNLITLCFSGAWSKFSQWNSSSGVRQYSRCWYSLTVLITFIDVLIILIPVRTKTSYFWLSGTTLIEAEELNWDVPRYILEGKARPTFLLIPRRTPEEHFSLQLKTKTANLYLQWIYVLLQKAPISQSWRPLKVL